MDNFHFFYLLLVPWGHENSLFDHFTQWDTITDFTVKKGNWQGRLHSYSLVHCVRTGKQFVAPGFSSSKPYVTPMLLDEVDFGSLLRSVDVISEGPRGVPRRLGTDFSAGWGLLKRPLVNLTCDRVAEGSPWVRYPGRVAGCRNTMRLSCTLIG